MSVETQETTNSEPTATSLEGAVQAATNATEATSPANDGDESEGDDESSDGADASGGEGAADGATDGAADGKKKRKRKKKKKVELTADGKEAPKRELPFNRFFSDGRKHGFAAGEIIAGRVAKLENGVAVIDLFGKTSGFCSANEPKEVPVVVEPEVVEAAAGDGTTSSAGAIEAVEVETAIAAHDAEHAAAEEPADLAEANSASEVHAAEANLPEEQAAVEEAPQEPELELGTIFKGRVASVAESGHLAICNRLAKRPEVRTLLAKAKEERRRVFGIVFGYNRGGFDVLVEGIRAFCPVSGLVLGHVDNPETLLGQKLEFSVQQAKSGQQGIVVSRRNILEREARKRAKELRKSLVVGQTVKGTISDIREFGVFVDLGGIEGLIHISELSWDRAARPTDVVQRGQEIEAKIIKLGEPQAKPVLKDGEKPEKRDRKREGRVSLSLKALQPDPWTIGLADIGIGSVKLAKIVRLADFGAFMEIAPGVEALLHITELGKDLKHPSEKAKVGDEFAVVVDKMDIPGRRVSLSKLNDVDAKAFAAGELEGGKTQAGLKPGAHLKVKVIKVEAFGISVQIEGVLGKRGRGLIPNNEAATLKGSDHRKQFPVGMELDVKFIGTERDGTLKLSRKGFLNDEERKAVQDYRKEAATKGFGTFADLLKSKLNA